MRRDVNTRLDRLAGNLRGPAEPLCIHHGSACGIGTRELSELYRMVIEAKRAQGQEVPPLDEHRLMTAEERKQYKREAGELLAAVQAKNDQIDAELRDEKASGVWESGHTTTGGNDDD